jgi:hypothetical protein
MSDHGDEDRDPPADAAPRKGAGAGDDREARLAAALRANLRRRKAATRTPEAKGEPETER